MDINRSYEEAKNDLIVLYNRLLAEGVIDNQAEVTEQIQLLDAEVFTISVCGAIKTGKSTLLNYLLFEGQAILPVDATPETAILAKISYGERETFVIHYLNKASWDTFRKGLNEADSKAITDKLNSLASKNIYPKDLIKETPHTETQYDLKKLTEYISKDSIYVPLIEFVEVFVPHENLKNIIVVDTPGLNDPCEARSQITLEWINKTDAAVYLFSATQPLKKQDKDFMDSNLSHIAPEKLLLVLGMIDHIDEHTGVKDYIQNVFDIDKFKDRVYLHNAKIYPISIMAAMLKTKPECIKDLDHYTKIISSDLIENEGFVPSFTDAVSNSLMQSKGEDIIQSHRTKIKKYLDDLLYRTELQIGSLRDRLENYAKPFDVLEKKKKEIARFIKELDDIVGSEEGGGCKKRVKDEIGKVGNYLSEIIKEVHDLILRNYRKECGENSFDVCVINTPAFFRSALKGSLIQILGDKKLQEISTEIAEIFRNTNRQIQKICPESFESYEITIHTPAFSLKDFFEIVDKTIDNELSKSTLISNRERVLSILWTKKVLSKEQLISSVEITMNDLMKVLQERVIHEIKSDISTQTDRYYHEYLAVSKSIQSNLQESISSGKELQDKIEKVTQEASLKKQNLENVQSLKSEILSKMSLSTGD